VAGLPKCSPRGDQQFKNELCIVLPPKSNFLLPFQTYSLGISRDITYPHLDIS